MVLELLSNPKIERTHKIKFFFVGFLYTLIASGLAIFVFPSQATIVSVFLVVLAIGPFMYHMLEREEIKELSIHTRRGLFKEYWNIISVLLLLFAGISLAYTLLFVLFPESYLFTYQSGLVETSQIPTLEHFQGIFLNNLTVLLLCLLFSFFFSFGAIFILAFNASIIGVAIGSTISQSIQTGSVLIGLVAFIQYIPHGIFEITAYFVAGIAGSFLSFAILHKEFLYKKFQTTVNHVIFLFCVSLVLLLIGAIVEVWFSSIIGGYATSK
ncbi:MAG: stage II sporulation protein M [Candidatus Woesearchaeota archaeon]